MKSRFHDTRSCYVCGKGTNLHTHHIYHGRGLRKLSEKYGCTVVLCAAHHNLSNEGVHFNDELDKRFKRECQEWLEANGMTTYDFMNIFGRNYR